MTRRVISAHGNVHAADAVAAGLALMEILRSSAPITSPVCCSPQDPLNLLAAVAL